MAQSQRSFAAKAAERSARKTYLMETGSSIASLQAANILSSITRVANINGGYTVTNTVYQETGKGTTSSSTVYTVYDRTASISNDHTPRYGLHIDTYA